MKVGVSVILPTFNRAESLRFACESVLSQSYQDLELIVVDDASSEDI
jgi:glycosyltransferase involved in cell wall biosynthesis